MNCMRKIAILLTCMLFPLFLAGQAGEKAAELFDAVQNSDLSALQALIKDPADLELRNAQRRTLLHEAAYLGKTDMVRFLLSKNLNIASRDFAGWQPLHDAVFKNHQETVLFLLDQKASPNAQNNKGQTPLHLAVEQKLTDMIKILVGREANIFIGDMNGLTVLHLAAAQGNMEYVAYFVSLGLSVNIKDNRGRTPLFDAVQSGHLEVVKYLVEQGAMTDLQDYAINNPTRPLNLAATPDMRSFLEAQGATSAQPFFNNAFSISPSFRYAHVIEDRDITYGGVILEWYLNSSFSFYWSFYAGKGASDNDTYYHMPGMGIFLHSFLTLFHYNYDKEINANNWHFMAAMILSALLPEGFTYHYWVDHYFDLGIYASLTNLDIRKKSAEDKTVYIGGEVGLRYTFYPYKSWSIAPFTSVEILFDEGDTGFNAGLNISYTF